MTTVATGSSIDFTRLVNLQCDITVLVKQMVLER